MLRSASGENLNTSKYVSLTVIRKECSRLVRFIQAEDSGEDGTLELNHSAVFAFLREDSDITEVASEERAVLPYLICDLCVKYLSQPRYSKLLTRRTHYEFTTWSGENFLTHQLLLYTAKYWYRHCEERATSPDYHERLRQFIFSRNFYTLIQVQSLSIIGHFLLSFDRITGQPTSMKKILPACAKDVSDAQILPQFNDFLYEWSEFLQLGLTSEFNGEIDRCFWRALGPEHFLRLGQERYHSFHFASPQTTTDAGASTQKLCFFHSLTSDGQELVLCRVQSSKYVAMLPGCDVTILIVCRECEDGALSLFVERWSIDGTRTPSLVETISLNVSCTDVQWSLYSTPCSRKLELVPRSTSIISPGGFALLDGRSGLRVGSRIILNTVRSESTPAQATTSGTIGKTLSDEEILNAGALNPGTIGMPKDATILTEYCEEVAHQANLLVICRRKIPRSETSETGLEKMSRHSRNTRRRRNLSDSSSGDSSTSDQESVGDDDENDTRGPAFSDASSLKSAASSDTLRSASEDSEYSNENSSGFGSENASSLSEEAKMVSDSGEGSDDLDICEDAEEDNTSGSDSKSLLSVATSDSSDEEVHDTLVDGEDDNELGSHYEYPVGITGQPQVIAKVCDSCAEDQQETWYHCAICQHSNYDLCHECVKRGTWCLNKEHQLYEEISEEGVVSVISWSRFVLGQEILVFDTTSTMEKPIFTHSLSESAALHQSAPIIHHLVPLVVWPICAGKLLFADTSKRASSKRRSFSLQSFKATSSKGTLSL